MKNKIITINLKSQLDQVVLHEQLGNGTAISDNLSAYQVDVQFETPRKVSRIEQRHLWIEERLVGHRMFQATLIVPLEMQSGEA